MCECCFRTNWASFIGPTAKPGSFWGEDVTDNDETRVAGAIRCEDEGPTASGDGGTVSTSATRRGVGGEVDERRVPGDPLFPTLTAKR